MWPVRGMDGRMRPAGKPRAPPSPFLWCPAVGQLALPAPKPLCGMLRDPAFLQACLHLTPRPPPADPESPPGQWAPLLPQESPQRGAQRAHSCTPKGFRDDGWPPRMAFQTPVAASRGVTADAGGGSTNPPCHARSALGRSVMLTDTRALSVPSLHLGQVPCEGPRSWRRTGLTRTRRREAGVDKARGPCTTGAA